MPKKVTCPNCYTRYSTNKIINKMIKAECKKCGAIVKNPPEITETYYRLLVDRSSVLPTRLGNLAGAFTFHK